MQVATPQPWPLSARYMKIAPDTATTGELERNRSVAFLVIHRDSILYESYWDGYSDSSLSNSFSMAKSYVGALTGIALKEGLIKNLDQTVDEFIPEYRNSKKGKLTLWQLLTMSAALSWDEAYASLFSVTTEAYYGKDLQGLMDRLEVVGVPGKEYNYQGGATQLLAMVLMKASGKSLSDYCEEKLWKPLGAVHTAEWSLDHAKGMEKASCCVYSNARDFARLGALYLHKGNWKGKQLIDTSYIEASVTPSPLLDNGKPNTEYGYQWWISKADGKEVFYCRGILGQYIVVIPSMQLVIVRLGHLRRQAADGSLLDLPVYLKGAIKMAEKNPG
jgi:CubicO group peptidase (beta-lactamase class C family)